LVSVLYTPLAPEPPPPRNTISPTNEGAQAPFVGADPTNEIAVTVPGKYTPLKFVERVTVRPLYIFDTYDALESNCKKEMLEKSGMIRPSTMSLEMFTISCCEEEKITEPTLDRNL